MFALPNVLITISASNSQGVNELEYAREPVQAWRIVEGCNKHKHRAPPPMPRLSTARVGLHGRILIGMSLPIVHRRATKAHRLTFLPSTRDFGDAPRRRLHH